LKSIKLTDILSRTSIEEIGKVFGSFLEKLAGDYIQANKIKEFPYQVSVRASPLITFENPNDLVFDASAIS
jgi:hypothetical protein